MLINLSVVYVGFSFLLREFSAKDKDKDTDEDGDGDGDKTPTKSRLIASDTASFCFRYFVWYFSWYSAGGGGAGVVVALTCHIPIVAMI